MENQAIQLSSEARDESRMADSILKDVANMERGIPASLKVAAHHVCFTSSRQEVLTGSVKDSFLHAQVGMDAMVSRLGGLTEAADGDIPGFEALRDRVHPDMTAALDLLTRGRAAQLVRLALATSPDIS